MDLLCSESLLNSEIVPNQSDTYRALRSGISTIEIGNLYPYGGVAEWLRRSVSNPVVGTTNHKPTVNSAVHPSEVGK